NPLGYSLDQRDFPLVPLIGACSRGKEYSGPTAFPRNRHGDIGADPVLYIAGLVFAGGAAIIRGIEHNDGLAGLGGLEIRGRVIFKAYRRSERLECFLAIFANDGGGSAFKVDRRNKTAADLQMFTETENDRVE